MYGTLALPDGRLIARPGWSPSPDVLAAREAALRQRYFVVRIGGNAGVGEVWRCKNCGGRHPYFTRNCVEMPFNGLDQAVYALYHQAGDLAAVRSLDPRQRAQHQAAQAVLKPVLALPDLATAHPYLAAQQARERRLEQFDVEMGGMPLGRIEEIPRSLAQRLLDKVNANMASDARVLVEGLEAR